MPHSLKLFGMTPCWTWNLGVLALFAEDAVIADPVGTITTAVGGHRMDADGVFRYRIDQRGRLLSLRAYWEFDRALKTLRS
jgi:hypothetical protein